MVFSNLVWSYDHRRGCDEIDLLFVGPSGVRVVEIKGWGAPWIRQHYEYEVKTEAQKVAMKAKRVGSALRQVVPSLPRVDGVILCPGSNEKPDVEPLFGVNFFALADWDKALGIHGPGVLDATMIERLARSLEPRIPPSGRTRSRPIGEYQIVETLSPPEETFHRLYRAVHSSRRDRVLLHLYDLFALPQAHQTAETRARREFDALLHLQRYRWAPRIIDSFQPAPGYVGEMYFFTILEPGAPPVRKRLCATDWKPVGRIRFVCNAFQALAELHSAGTGAGPMVHRNLTLDTVLVAPEDQVIFTGFEITRIPSEPTVITESVPADMKTDEVVENVVAPEVRTGGPSAATAATDVFAMCAIAEAVLRNAPDGDGGARVEEALELIGLGLEDDPASRPSAATMAELLGSLADSMRGTLSHPPVPPARYWSEGQVVEFKNRQYRVATRLGTGGIGTAFKVAEISSGVHEGEELGYYVAKTVHDGAQASRILDAYRLVRPHVGRHPELSTVFEVADECRENSIVALLSWVEGIPLAELCGVVPLMAEDLGITVEGLVLGWLGQACRALKVLHDAGLVHGDVSPRNLVVNGRELVLTDYDLVHRVGQAMTEAGTKAYCSPNVLALGPASPHDDIFALAASIYRVLYDKEPFEGEAAESRVQGLRIDQDMRDAYPLVARFLELATRPASTTPMADGSQALAWLEKGEPLPEQPGPEQVPSDESTGKTQGAPQAEVGEQPGLHVGHWVGEILRSYAGSKLGNRETRGLDAESSWKTYVPTPLENTLRDALLSREKRLVILCGNAGDGKTALLQHLAHELGMGRPKSADRVVKQKLPNGLVVTLNFDGSAAWGARSSDELLDDFFSPFLDCQVREDVAGVLAINDGRLLEWLLTYRERHPGQEEPELVERLLDFMEADRGETDCVGDEILFLDLNRRCLVGDIDPENGNIDTTFLDQLVDRLYGGEEAPDIWRGCGICVARDHCRILEAARLFGPAALENLGWSLPEPERRRRARRRLYRALQAVHVGGRVHITMRELRGALAYVLFGTEDCAYYQAGGAEAPGYWDRAFSPAAPYRQGLVLEEMVRLDPGLDSHPVIDRYLSQRRVDYQNGPLAYPGLNIQSAKRRAYFEWLPEEIEKLAGDWHALDLTQGQALDKFLVVAASKPDAQESSAVCHELCRGLSRLEDLPPVALHKQGVVPIRVVPRTPTETLFWAEKQASRFSVEVVPSVMGGKHGLPRELVLKYEYQDGTSERLAMSLRLFSALLAAAEGYQLGDIASDELFSRVEIFMRRLAREDERALYVWTPLAEERVFAVRAISEQADDGVRQTLALQVET